MVLNCSFFATSSQVLDKEDIVEGRNKMGAGQMILRELRQLSSSYEERPNLCAEAQRAWQQPGDATHLTWPELADSFSFLMFFVFV